MKIVHTVPASNLDIPKSKNCHGHDLRVIDTQLKTTFKVSSTIQNLKGVFGASRLLVSLRQNHVFGARKCQRLVRGHKIFFGALNEHG